MPLYRIHYTHSSERRSMIFAAVADPEACSFAHSVLGRLIGVPIERVERVENRPWKRHHLETPPETHD